MNKNHFSMLMPAYQTHRSLPCIIGIAVCLAIGLIGGIATETGAVTWYPTLAQPAFTPPASVFGPVWTTLYILMGIAAGLVYQTPHPERKHALIWFTIQLFFNGIWSFIFFMWHQISLAAVDLALIWVSLIITMRYFYRVWPITMYLLIPYLLWATFAFTVNLSLIYLN